MSNVFEFSGGGDRKRWNYSDPKSTDNPMTLQISGVLVEMSNPQKKDFKTKAPCFWEDGNPIENLGLTILRGDTGEEEFFEITPSKNSVAMQALDNAFKAFGEANGITFNKRSDYCVAGKPGYVITIATQDGNYGSNNPRPWTIQVIGIDQNGIAVRGCIDLQNPKQTVAPQQPATPPAPAPAAPVAQPQAPVAQAPVAPVQPQQPQQPQTTAVQAAQAAQAAAQQAPQVPANPAQAVAQMAGQVQQNMGQATPQAVAENPELYPEVQF